MSDGFGGTDTDDVAVDVADTERPDRDGVADAIHAVAAEPQAGADRRDDAATDVCAGDLPVLASIASNEPDNGLGNGDTTGDVAVPRSGERTRRTRSARSGRARDPAASTRSGNSDRSVGQRGAATATVTVAK